MSFMGLLGMTGGGRSRRGRSHGRSSGGGFFAGFLNGWRDAAQERDPIQAALYPNTRLADPMEGDDGQYYTPCGNLIGPDSSANHWLYGDEPIGHHVVHGLGNEFMIDDSRARKDDEED